MVGSADHRTEPTTAHRGFSKPNHYLNAFIVLMALSTCCGESEVGASVIGGGSGEEVVYPPL